MKKIFLSLVGLLLIIGCSSEQKVEEKYQALVGKTYNNKIYNMLGGEVETLKGTDAKKWIAYFPKADITIVERKKDYKILEVHKGRWEQY